MSTQDISGGRGLEKLVLVCSAFVLVGCSIYEPYPLVRSASDSQAEGSGVDSSVASTDTREDSDAGSSSADGEAAARSRSTRRRADAGSSSGDAKRTPVDAATAADRTKERMDAPAAGGAGASPPSEGADAAVEPASANETPATEPSEAADAGTPAADGCTRQALLDRAQGFLAAMASSNPLALTLHPNVRFTENGQERLVGLGLWLDGARPEFARHIVEERSCSTATEAVLRTRASRIVFGARLRYVNDQLLEIETQFVRSDGDVRYFAPDQIIPESTDPWTVPLESSDQRTAQELLTIAMRYFDSSSDASLLPQSAEGCRRRLNGALLDLGCGVPPGNRRFDQARFPVVDETTGIITAVVAYQGAIYMYLIKQRAGKLENIEAIGGAQSQSTGW